MIVREATANDIPTLIGFQIKMAKETENVLLDSAVVQLGMTELFNDVGKGKYYVAEVNGIVAGCLMTTFEWSEWRNGNVIWIQSVYIGEEFRGNGVYKTMYLFIQNIVRNDPKLRGIRLYADKNNSHAMKVYERLGMNGEHYQVFEWMK